MSSLWVALDVGCLECDEDTEVIGIFATLPAAQDALAARQRKLGYEKLIVVGPKACGRFQLHEVKEGVI